MSIEPRLLVAVDLGSSGLKLRSAVVEADGTVRRQRRRTIPHWPVRRGGALVWDVERVVLDALDNERRVHPSLEPAVCIDSWGSDFALVDATGTLARPLRSYRDPAFAVGYARSRRLGLIERMRKRSGCAVGRDSTLAQLLTALEEDPGLLQRELTLLPVADYLGLRLSGAVSAGCSSLSTTGLLDPSTGAVDRAALDGTGVPERWFPDPLREESVVGPLLRDSAPGLDGLLIKVAGHDTAAALHAGFPGSGRVFLSLGSWAVTGVIVDEDLRVSAPFSLPDVQHELCSDGSLRVNRNVPGLRLLQRLEAEWFGGPATSAQRDQLLREAKGFPDGLFEASELDAMPEGGLDAWLDAEARARGAAALTRAARYGLALDAIASGIAGAVRELEAAGLVGDNRLWICGGGVFNFALLECIERYTGYRLEVGSPDASAEGGLRGLARVLGIGELDLDSVPGEDGTGA